MATKNSHLIQMLKAHRTKHGLSQEKMADRLGVARDTLAKWEVGIAFPRQYYWEVIAKEFGVTVAALFPDSYNGQAPPIFEKYERLSLDDKEDVDYMIEFKFQRMIRKSSARSQRQPAEYDMEARTGGSVSEEFVREQVAAHKAEKAAKILPRKQ